MDPRGDGEDGQGPRCAHGLGAGKVTWCHLPYVPPASSYVVRDSLGGQTGGDDLSKVIAATFERYAVSNPVHPDVFPSIRKMEAEIAAMCLRMYDNPGVAGTMTSKSIVMGIKTYRDWARDVKDMTEPECERFSFSL